MYLPELFKEEDEGRLRALIRDHGFGVLITEVDGAPFASHLPLLLDAERGANGTILGHMARANPQWRSFRPGGRALAIFQGPHCYVSPSWYVTTPNVPTWNYAAVHAYGVPSQIADKAAVRALLGRLVERHESRFETPWREDSLDDELMASLIASIVAFEMPVERLEGKFKLNQNRTAEDRAAVRARLGRSDDPAERAVAALMEERLGSP